MPKQGNNLMKIGKQFPWICLIFKIVSEKEKSSKNQRDHGWMDLAVWVEWFDHDRIQKGGKCPVASGPQGRNVTIIKERWRNNSTSNNQWTDALVMPCYLGTRNLLLIFARLCGPPTTSLWDLFCGNNNNHRTDRLWLMNK